MANAKISTLIHSNHMGNIGTYIISAHFFGAACAANVPSLGLDGLNGLDFPWERQPEVISSLIALFRLLSDDHLFFLG